MLYSTCTVARSDKQQQDRRPSQLHNNRQTQTSMNAIETAPSWRPIQTPWLTPWLTPRGRVCFANELAAAGYPGEPANNVRVSTALPKCLRSHCDSFGLRGTRTGHLTSPIRHLMDPGTPFKPCSVAAAHTCSCWTSSYRGRTCPCRGSSWCIMQIAVSGSPAAPAYPAPGGPW